eukprot:TRINITY_DN224_c0_g3_i1.p1 TRINITY_DN224_c0_g3~~TRINITY_DN224_c0_g3_i1.p1  ORF type:complete len:658 (-),score=233.52 TRINITY_DN224_c0_g3_i1:172-2145(-)
MLKAISTNFGRFKPFLGCSRLFSTDIRGSIIGIDLGTTNSCVAVMEGKDPRVIENSEGQRTTPSVVAFHKDGTRLVGLPAKRQAVTNPKTTFFATKRLIGRRFEDPEITKAASMVPYDIISADNGDAWVKYDGKQMSPAEIASMVLVKMKETAETFLGHDVKHAVITVPAYFDDSQRQATKDAGMITGLNVERIINEPTAAAMAYGMSTDIDQVIAVYDLGGGTFDISILEISEGCFEVKATNGDTLLGGEDFDDALYEHLAKDFKRTEGFELNDPVAIQRLRDAAEKCKRELDNLKETDIHIPFISANEVGPIHFSTRVSQATFENLSTELVKRSMGPVAQCLKDAGIEITSIDEILMVGGMTRTPMVTREVEKFFKQKACKGVNPDEVVAMGAAIQGGVLKGDVKDVLLLDVTPLSLGIETFGGIFSRLIPRNTTIPTKKSEIFSTAADDQSQVEIKVLQGERDLAIDNKTLGRFDLIGIPPAPRGVPQIEVAFDIDADGILHVSATDKATNKEQSIRIESSSGLTKDEIERIVNDAETFKVEDEERRKLIELRNEAKQMAYRAANDLEEHKDALSEDDQVTIQNAIDELEKNVDTAEIDPLTEHVEHLRKAIMKIGEVLYQKEQEDGGQEANNEEYTTDDDNGDDDGDDHDKAK